MPGMPSDGAGDPNAPELDMPWELYDLRSDPSQSRNVAAEHPELVRDLARLWYVEAGRYGAFPVNAHVLNGTTPRPDPDRQVFTYFPGTSTVPNDTAPKTIQRPFSIDARFSVGGASDEGVIIAQGGKFGGWTVFVKDARVHYEYNYLGLEHTTLTSDPLDAGEHHLVIDVALADPFEIAPALTALGINARSGRVTMRLDGGPDQAIAVPRMIPFNYSLTGEGLCCGWDSETAVSDAYVAPFRFTGSIARVQIALDGEEAASAEKDAERARLVQ
jgi:arylsulfatase